MKISDIIKNRLKENNKRFFACDNVSEFISDSERDLLIQELSEKFDEVLKSLIIDIDNDPNSQETGHRLAKMYINEIMQGRYYSPPKITAFPNDGDHAYTGMLVVRAEIRSLCSHHHQEVSGTAYIGIIPNKKVLGLSKYIRIAQHCARRGTLQEELTSHIVDSIKRATDTDDVACYIAARHGCVECRGVGAYNSTTQTTVLSGAFKTADVKREFFDNIQLQEART